MRNTYGSYLQLDRLLSAQRTVTESDDEMLFIIIHQAQELWMKLLLHELAASIKLLTAGAASADALLLVCKHLSRCTNIQRSMIQSWEVLSTLTPDEFSTFRASVGKDNASGFQSYQYRALEFTLGLKYRAIEMTESGGRTRRTDLFKLHRHPDIVRFLEACLKRPSIYQACLLFMSGKAFGRLIARRAFGPYHASEAVRRAWRTIYKDRRSHMELYQLAETLVDVEDLFRQWRFRHVATVSRVIGSVSGTGGSAGLRYLLDKAVSSYAEPLFPELWEVRAEFFDASARPSPLEENHRDTEAQRSHRGSE